MHSFHYYIDMYIGGFLILSAFCLIIIPPKFGNCFYGIATEWTLKNEMFWAYGHKLFALAIISMGLIFFTLGAFHLSKDIPPFVMFVLLVVLWTTSKYLVHKILKRKSIVT